MIVSLEMKMKYRAFNARRSFWAGILTLMTFVGIGLAAES